MCVTSEAEHIMSSTLSSVTLGLQSRRISALLVESPSQSDPFGRALCRQIHHHIGHHATGQGPFAGESLGAFPGLRTLLAWSLCASGGTGWRSGKSAALHLI